MVVVVVVVMVENKGGVNSVAVGERHHGDSKRHGLLLLLGQRDGEKHCCRHAWNVMIGTSLPWTLRSYF